MLQVQIRFQIKVKTELSVAMCHGGVEEEHVEPSQHCKPPRYKPKPLVGFFCREVICAARREDGESLETGCSRVTA